MELEENEHKLKTGVFSIVVEKTSGKAGKLPKKFRNGWK